MVTERDGSELQVQEVKLQALDELVLDALQPLPAAVAGCLEARAKLETGNVDGAISALSRVCPELIQDAKYRFKLVKQKFVELCCSGADGAAIACARDELAPLALDAYPEAYGEFKSCLQLLVYTKDVQRQQHGAIRDLCTPAARSELAAAVYHAAMLTLGAQLPTLLKALTYLLRVHRDFRAGAAPAAGADAHEHALLQQLLLPARDAPPLPCDAGPTSFREADVQALILCAGCSRRAAMDAIKLCRGDVQRAFCAELSRMRLDAALLGSLLEEYAAERGLAAGPREQSSSSWLGVYGTPQAPDPGPEAMDTSVSGQEEAPQLTEDIPCWLTGDAAAGAPAHAAPSSSQASYPPGVAASKWGPWSVRQHLHLLHPERSISQSPPAKVPRCQGDGSGVPTPAAQPNPWTPSKLSGSAPQGARLQELPQRVAEMVRGGQVQEVIQLVAEVDGGFWEQHVELLFDFKRCQFLQQLDAGDTGRALVQARAELAPLAAAHPALQPALKATMATLLGGAAAAASAPPALERAGAGLQAALRLSLGLRGPALVKLLQLLLAAHRAWVRREKFADPFQGPLRLDSLREPSAALLRHVSISAATALPAAAHSSPPDLVSSSDPDDDELGLDEERILRLMEVLEINRSSAFELLLHHEGDVEAAIMSSLT